MTRDSIEGFMLGLGAGVAIAYLLKPLGSMNIPGSGQVSSAGSVSDGKAKTVSIFDDDPRGVRVGENTGR